MVYQPLEKLLSKSKYSVYTLVRMAAKRSMELADGAPHLVEHFSSQKTTTIALEEIIQGKVSLKDVAKDIPSSTGGAKGKEKPPEKSQEKEQSVQV